MSPGNRENSRLVYSTHAGRVKDETPARQAAPAGDGVVRVSRTKAGRRGKTVTVVTGLPASELRSVARELKRSCGVGGAVKDGAVELQGDQREAVAAMLSERYQVVRAGG